MDRESMERLRMDRRLIRRRGWLKDEERERMLAELPDVSHKVAPAKERGFSEEPGERPAATPDPEWSGE